MVPCNMFKQVPKILILELAVVEHYGDDDLVSFVSMKCMNEPPLYISEHRIPVKRRSDSFIGLVSFIVGTRNVVMKSFQ